MRVLLAYDGSSGAEAARDLAAHLSWPEGTAITVVAALERGPALFGAPDFALTPQNADEAEAVLLADLQEMLHAAAAPLRAVARQIETRVIRGRPASALLDEALALLPDLIIVGSRGHGPLATVLLGSVSTEVVDHAPCPVLVARGPSVHRAVIGVDGSESAQRCVDTLARWPIFAGLPARVVTVAEPPPMWSGSMGPALYPAWSQVPDEDNDDDRRQQLTDVGTRACGQLARGGLRPTSEVRIGDAAQQLIAAATEDDADLIVVGTRGLTTLSRLVIGSVARKVLLHAPTSVLVIRPSRSPARVTERTNVMSLAALA